MRTAPPLSVRLERLWSRVQRRSPDLCWPWTSTTLKSGAGVISWLGPMGSRTRQAHEVVYEVTFGPYSEARDMVVHTCQGGPLCCNPGHLALCPRSGLLGGELPAAVGELYLSRLLRGLPAADLLRAGPGYFVSVLCPQCQGSTARQGQPGACSRCSGRGVLRQLAAGVLES